MVYHTFVPLYLYTFGIVNVFLRLPRPNENGDKLVFWGSENVQYVWGHLC